MDTFSQRLRKRAAQLGISNAEAARKVGLDERRFAHYASGRREPDLATLVLIAERLGCTPNWLLGVPDDRTTAFADPALADRLLNAGAGMNASELRIVVLQVEGLVRHKSSY